MSEPVNDNELPATSSLDEYRDKKTMVIKDLIEKSSLGTPDAAEAGAQTPPEVTDEILRRAGILPSEEHIAKIRDLD